MIKCIVLCRGIISSVTILVLLLLSSCAIKPTHESLKSQLLPELIKVRTIVANTKYRANFNISPDGKKLAWNAVSGLKDAILWRDIDDDRVSALRFNKNAPRPYWSSNSQYIFYHDDPSGSENYHVYAIDTLHPDKNTRDLTPYPGVKAYVHKVPVSISDQIYVSHNRRDKAIFDVYTINIVTGEETLLYKNSENIINLFIDDQGQIRARVRQTDSARILEVLQDDLWIELLNASKFDDIDVLDFSLDGETLYIISNVDRDKKAFVAYDLNSGIEKVIYEHKITDINHVLLSSKDKRPLLTYADPDYFEIIFFDDHLKQQLAQFQLNSAANRTYIKSMDRQERVAIIVSADITGRRFYLLDLQSGDSQLLADSSYKSLANTLVDKTPITITASDGMQLHGYLSLPRINGAKNLPTILLVHGGPWARDWWGYHPSVQLLANRGYAVIQINYRGSAGYGREYMYAGKGEFAGKMHQDLIDTIDWAIDKNISDPEKIAIMGGSYGGYATLVGMTMTPDRFACGVDNVGVSDLASLIESFPAYWNPWIHYWHHFVGDPSIPAQRKVMDLKSPINYVDQVISPLLIFHGVNDPRVKIDQSDRMVKALKDAGKEVEYFVIKNEGHGSSHWKNQLKYYREVEDFLANCLGGRSSGFDYFQLGSWAF